MRILSLTPAHEGGWTFLRMLAAVVWSDFLLLSVIYEALMIDGQAGNVLKPEFASFCGCSRRICSPMVMYVGAQPVGSAV